MKRSKPWLMLILIASVLLLSGVRSACDEPRNNKQTNQIETGSHQHHASGNPIATPINQKNPDATPTETPAETYNYYGHFNYVPARRIQSGGFWVVAGQVAYVASAVLVAIFTGALVVISRYQWNVAQQSADAAKQSAVAATTTANVLIGAESAYLDITYIGFTSVTVSTESVGEGGETSVWADRLRPNRPLVASVIIKNIGRTPAFEIDTLVEFRPIPTLPDWNPRQVAGRAINVLGAGESKPVECRCESPFTQAQVDEIESGRVKLHARWQFSFTGIADSTYDEWFDSFYKPGAIIGPHFDFPGYPRMRRRRTK